LDPVAWFKILTDEVSRAIKANPAVLEAAVVGLQDPRCGQVPAAAYTLARGAADPGEDALSAFLRQSLTAIRDRCCSWLWMSSPARLPLRSVSVN
jgi:acyl-coenzyme A synthetase/AMP-(fatty) acid ligase